MPILNATAGVDALLVGLLTFALRATPVLLGAWLATKLLRRASAATRHLIWTSAIAAVLTLPLLSAVVPAWNVPVVTIPAQTDSPLEPVIAPPAPENVAIETRRVEAQSNIPTAAVPTAVAGGKTTGVAQRLSGELNARTILALAWLILALLMLARLAIANARVAAWQRSSRPVEDGRWLTLVRRLSRQYGIERPVVLLENEETDVPVTWGIVYPVILLPATAGQWDEEQSTAVLTHELAHVKRFDALSQLLAQLALALLWFHPLVWMAVRRMRLEREHACDDFVLVAGARASRYADDLLGLARRLRRPTAPAAAALAMARRSELEGRLLAILDPAMKRSAVRRARVVLLTLGVVLLSVPLAAFRPTARVTFVPPVQEAAPPPKQPSDVPVTREPRVVQQPAAPSELEVSQFQASQFQASQFQTSQFEALMQRVRGGSLPALKKLSAPPQSLQDTVDIQTLIEVTKAAKKMSSDYEKGQLLALISKHYQRSEPLREAFLDAVFSMTSDYERSKALIALLDRDSLPSASTARVLRSATLMTSDMNRGMVLKRVSPATFGDTAVQRAYLEVIVAMSSDFERAGAVSSLVKQRPLTRDVQLALLRAIGPISSSTEKAGVLLLFVERQGIADETVRHAFVKAAESLTSDHDYRRVMSAVLR